jgi:hypothetical protein
MLLGKETLYSTTDGLKMWSTYTGYSEAIYSIVPSITRLGSAYDSTKFGNEATTFSGSAEGAYTDYSPDGGYTIAGGSITYLDSDSNLVVNALNITSRLETTTTVNSDYVLQRTSVTQAGSYIVTTYTQQTTTSTDSPTKTLSTGFTYNNLIQVTSFVNVAVTSITTSGPTILVGFSNSEFTAYGTSKNGVYMVVHPSIGYPWTSDHQTMEFMQTFTYNSSLTGDTNSVKWLISGTDAGGLSNIVAENNSNYPKIIYQSSTTSLFGLIYDSGIYPTSGGTITVIDESTSTISYQSLSTATTTTSVQSRYVYISSLSRFTTTESLTESVTAWSTSSAVETFTLRNQLTLFMELDPGGENTYESSESYTASFSAVGVYFNTYGNTRRLYGYYYRTKTQVDTRYTTSLYTHVNSGMNGVYFNTFTFEGLALTTTETSNAEYWGDVTSVTISGSSSEDGFDSFTEQSFSGSYIQPYPEPRTLSFTHGINTGEVNRIYAFSDYYQQPAITTYIRSPNYNFAIGATGTNGYIDIRHGGYVEKINPESLLSNCFWSYYQFERTANINVPVLAYPINTQSTNSSGATIQSVQIPVEFFNGKDIASIYRTTLVGTAQTITSHTCSYGVTEEYKNMILESLELADVSIGVLATVSHISNGAAKFELGKTFQARDYVFCNYLGKTYYFDYPPKRDTRGQGPLPHSAVGNNALGDQNLFTLVRLTNSGFPFTFTPKAFLASFTSMQ